MLDNSIANPKVISVISAGLIVALLEIIVSISLVALVFTGNFAVFLPQGIGIILFTSMAACAVLALTSQLKGVLSLAQDAGIVVLALVAHHFNLHFDQLSPESSFVTLVAFIALTSLATGAFFAILGRLNLGNLIRFIPFPVIGGFLATVGVILLQGAFSLITEHELAFTTIDELLATEALTRWLPAMILGVVLFVATRINNHYLVTPGLIVLSALIFFGVVLLSSSSIDAVQHDGWMLGPFTETSAWQPVFLEDLSKVDWQLILDQIWHIPSIALISTIALLLNLSGLEIQADEDVDINRELQIAGLTNLGLGLFGGFVGFQSISITLLGWRMNAKSRWTGILVAALFLVVVVFGFDLIAYFPKFILGGLLIFLAIAILSEWIYDGLFRMSHQDYAIMIIILVIVVTVGYLQGVGFGILAATTLFAFNYSRISNIKQTLTGQAHRSKVNRPRMLEQVLQAHGDRLVIFRLSGYIFFGSANSLLGHIITYLNTECPNNVRFLVLDFRQVQLVDSSAILTFIRLRQQVTKRNAVLLFCGVSDAACRVFTRSDFDMTPTDHFQPFGELDKAVEWCEDQLIASATIPERAIPSSFEDQLAGFFSERAQIDQVMAYMERIELPEGTVLARQGDTSTTLYWVESGRLVAVLESGEARQRVRVAQAGTVLGEMALYAGTVRSATIVADQPSVVHMLTREALLRMEDENPAIAARLNRMVATILSERLADTAANLRQYL